MSALDVALAWMAPYAPYLVLILVLVGLYGVVRGAIAGGGTTLGLMWLGILLFLGGILLALDGWVVYALYAFVLGGLVMIGDAFHERRLVRRAHARERG